MTQLPEPPDFDAVNSGQLPWSLEGLAEAIERWSELRGTPHDDWDRRRRGLLLEDDDGSKSEIVFNPDVIENQIMNWLMDRFTKHGLSQTEKVSHAWRLMEVQAFLAENHERLKLEGFIICTPEHPEAEGVSDALLSVLAGAPYEGVRLSGPKQEPHPTFHADRVIAEARSRLDSDED